MTGELPDKLNVHGFYYSIRTDFRDILKIVTAFGDAGLEPEEKVYICLYILYKDFDLMPQLAYQEAYKQALYFIDCGMASDAQNVPRTMDWEQDEAILFPAINKAAGREVRSADYIHWWTFMGYFMEIGDGVFAHVLNLRQKKQKRKKLEKWEREFWNANKNICVLRPKLTAEEQAAKDKLNAILG